MESREPASVSTEQRASTACAHNRQAVSSRDAGVHTFLTSDFSPVDNRILAMLQEWVCQHPMRDIDKLRQCLIDRQTVIDQVIDWW